MPTTTVRNAPLRTITLGQLLDYPFPHREDLVAPWLRQGESAMLWAPTGLGKTMLSLTLALAVAGGGSVLGWTSPKPRPVLYVDGEMNTQDLRDRLAMLANTVEGCDFAVAGRNLTVLSRQFQGGGVKFPDLAKENDQKIILTEADKIGAELVILDNFSTLAEVTDENDSAAMNTVLGFLLRMKQAGRACILVHHSGKSENDYRGSSRLAATFEVIIGLRRLDGRTVMDGAGFELQWDKYRGKPTAATRDIAVELGGPEGEPQWTFGPATRDDIRTLLAAVQTGQFHSQRELAKHLKWDPAKVTNVKKRAVSKSEITEKQWGTWLTRDDEGAADF